MDENFTRGYCQLRQDTPRTERCPGSLTGDTLGKAHLVTFPLKPVYMELLMPESEGDTGRKQLMIEVLYPAMV